MTIESREMDLSLNQKRRLPTRAYFVFSLTLILISVSIGLRVAGISLDRLGRALIDGPTLAAVAFSSLIWATYRNQKTLDLFHTKSPSEQEQP